MASYAEHGSFIRDIAAAKPPEHLNYLLNVLQASGTVDFCSKFFMIYAKIFMVNIHIYICIYHEILSYSYLISLSAKCLLYGLKKKVYIVS